MRNCSLKCSQRVTAENPDYRTKKLKFPVHLISICLTAKLIMFEVQVR